MAHLIAAIATYPQPSAIGVVRLSGEGCFRALDTVFRAKNGKSADLWENRKLTLGHLLDAEGRVLDEVLATVSRAPHSYTGEDTAELQCHGSPAVLSAALESLFRAGAQQAGPGEFTRRAFLNGQLDLTQAEAVIDLIEAQTARAAQNAAGQLAGSLTKKLMPIYDGITDILSHFHAVLDYPDEEIPEFRLEEFRATLDGYRATLESLENSYGRGQYLNKGVPAVILGSPNAGKSSLLNALAGYDRVIVTAIPGTTRDTVEETILLGGHAVRLTDTAGIRETTDTVEAMGVQRSMQAAQSAQLAIFVCDGSRPLTEEDRIAIRQAQNAPMQIGVINKCDLALAVKAEDLPFRTVITVSAKEGIGMDDLEAAAAALLADATPADGSILTNTRQLAAVVRAKDCLTAVLDSMDLGFTPDAVLVDAEAALEALGEMTGRAMREDVVNRIFERFCVGK